MSTKTIVKVIKIVSVTILLIGFVKCGLYFKNDFGYDTRDKEFISPTGQTKVLLRYDFVSRPFLFYNGELIFSYKGAGFMESVFFDIEWITEMEIRLYTEKYDEEYFITLEN